MPASKGFAEDQQSYSPKTDELRSVPHARLKIDKAGRVVIPAEMRAAMLAKPGETVTAEVVDGELRIMSGPVVLAHIQRQAREFDTAHPNVSLVDDLIADRRQEARREDEKYERLEREAAALAAGDRKPK
ncbi:MAG: AbrB/MazE/SpoVT family DNA-binding domain-containing protein [Rhizobiaceae bacterium]